MARTLRQKWKVSYVSRLVAALILFGLIVHDFAVGITALVAISVVMLLVAVLFPHRHPCPSCGHRLPFGEQTWLLAQFDQRNRDLPQSVPCPRCGKPVG